MFVDQMRRRAATTAAHEASAGVSWVGISDFPTQNLISGMLRSLAHNNIQPLISNYVGSLHCAPVHFSVVFLAARPVSHSLAGSLGLGVNVMMG